MSGNENKYAAKSDLDKLQFFSREEIEAVRKQNEAKGVKYPEQQKPEEAEKKKVIQELREMLTDADISIQSTQNLLRNAKRVEVERTIVPEVELRKFDKEAVENLEMALAKKISLKHGLEKTLSAFESGQKIPAESQAILRDIQEQAAQNLREAHAKKQKNPQNEVEYIAAQNKLRRITNLLEKMGL